MLLGLLACRTHSLSPLRVYCRRCTGYSLLLLPAYAVDGVRYVLRAKASCTAVGAGINACGDPHRTGNPVLGRRNRNTDVLSSGSASGLRVRRQRFDNRLIRHGSQTYSCCSGCCCGFDDRAIWHGTQTVIVSHGHYALFGDGWLVLVVKRLCEHCRDNSC